MLGALGPPIEARRTPGLGSDPCEYRPNGPPQERSQGCEWTPAGLSSGRRAAEEQHDCDSCWA